MRLQQILDLRCNHKLHDRTTFRGLNISIENRAGSVRKGVDKDGTPWSTKMIYPYGYIRRTKGADGDHVDCFIGPNEDAPFVYVIHTKTPETDAYSEDKVMLGFPSADFAKHVFLQHYDDEKFFGSMSVIPFDEFKDKVLDTLNAPKKITAGGPGSGRKASTPSFHNADELLPISRILPSERYGKSEPVIQRYISKIASGEKLEPILVQQYKNGAVIKDGHHRFAAVLRSGLTHVGVRNQFVPIARNYKRSA